MVEGEHTMDEVDKLLVEIASRASDALEEKEFMERRETGDSGAVDENIEDLTSRVYDLIELRRVQEADN